MRRTSETNDLMPSLNSHEMCGTHKSIPLNHDGICPMCDRLAFMAMVRTQEEDAEARKIQALTRIHT